MKDEIIIYQPDNKSERLEVLLDEETVWLTQSQIVTLFSTSKANVSEHIKNIYQTKELDSGTTVRKFRTVQLEGKRIVKRQIEHYCLDMIISIGYRVNSLRGTQFRIWANKILKEYLLKGYALNQRFEKIESDVHYLKTKVEKFDLQITTNLPPSEGIFFDGQIFDAYTFISGLIKSAKFSIDIIDNYIDESVLTLLTKRANQVKATIYTSNISNQLHLDVKKHNAQYPFIELLKHNKSHDRFLIIDNKSLYHMGASLKDLGKKWFAFSRLDIDPALILNRLSK
jgi:hypothetical protein